MHVETIINNYIHQHIPITNFMGATVKYATKEKVIVSAPFLENINHKSTVFGGSLHAITTLACWGLLYANFIEHLGKIDIVICSSQIDYKRPITQNFEAISLKPDQISWDKFETTLKRKEKGRIQIESNIYADETLCVSFKGIFAIIMH